MKKFPWGWLVFLGGLGGLGYFISRRAKAQIQMRAELKAEEPEIAVLEQETKTLEAESSIINLKKQEIEETTEQLAKVIEQEEKKVEVAKAEIATTTGVEQVAKEEELYTAEAKVEEATIAYQEVEKQKEDLEVHETAVKAEIVNTTTKLTTTIQSAWSSLRERLTEARVPPEETQRRETQVASWLTQLKEVLEKKEEYTPEELAYAAKKKAVCSTSWTDAYNAVLWNVNAGMNAIKSLEVAITRGGFLYREASHVKAMREMNAKYWTAQVPLKKVREMEQYCGIPPAELKAKADAAWSTYEQAFQSKKAEVIAVIGAGNWTRTMNYEAMRDPHEIGKFRYGSVTLSPSGIKAYQVMRMEAAGDVVYDIVPTTEEAYAKVQLFNQNPEAVNQVYRISRQKLYENYPSAFVIVKGSQTIKVQPDAWSITGAWKQRRALEGQQVVSTL